MRDWTAFVRSRLSLPDLAPEREARIVRELATQLEDICREAIAAGASESEADASAAGQITDWKRMARDVRLADYKHARSRTARLTTTIEDLAQPRRGVLQMLADTLTDMRYAARQLVKTPGFTIVAVLTLAFGIAWQASRSTLGAVLKEGGRSSTGSGGRWLRNSLLVAEVALSIVLLVGASLLLRVLRRSRASIRDSDPSACSRSVSPCRSRLTRNLTTRWRSTIG